MFVYKSLKNVGVEVLHKAFVEAFSDYQVKIDLPLWKFKQMLKRRGYVPEKSMGVFKDEALVGFILNGYREWNGKPTVYDVGTGVIPDYRKQGLTTNIFQKVSEMLRNEGVEQYLLEVMQQNTAAYELYRKKGFEITRSFSCYKKEKSDSKPQNAFKVENVDGFTAVLWDRLKEFWDFNPSWQNSIESVCALSGEFSYSVVYLDDEIVGYGIIEKKTGDIPQIAVDRRYRRKGIAGSIMSELVNNTDASRVSVLNVDEDSKAVKAFLSAYGFEQYVDQYEMIMDM